MQVVCANMLNCALLCSIVSLLDGPPFISEVSVKIINRFQFVHNVLNRAPHLSGVAKEGGQPQTGAVQERTEAYRGVKRHTGAYKRKQGQTTQC